MNRLWIVDTIFLIFMIELLITFCIFDIFWSVIFVLEKLYVRQMLSDKKIKKKIESLKIDYIFLVLSTSLLLKAYLKNSINRMGRNNESWLHTKVK